MAGRNYYDVTEWPVGNPNKDIGEVINSIIADIKSRQTDSDINDGGKPGAVIYIPSGDYHLATQVVIDISYLKIMDPATVLPLRVSDLMFRKMNGPICMNSGQEAAES